MYCIYKVTHKENGQFYIGYSKNAKRRWRDHKQAARVGEKSRFYNAMRKYGPDMFQFEIIEELGDCSLQEAKDREVFWIAELKPEYNCTKGGDGSDPDEETRRKMSEAIRNSPKNATRGKKAWETRKQNTPAEEWSRIMSEAQANMSPQAKAAKFEKMRDANLNRSPEDEAERQRKRAETIAARTPEEQARVSANLSAGIKARALTEEQQAKISEGQRIGGMIQGAKIREWYNGLSDEEKKARNQNIADKVSAKAALRTQEERDAITAKRLASRARNKALKQQQELLQLNAQFADC